MRSAVDDEFRVCRRSLPEARLVGEEGLDSGQQLPFPIVGAVDIGLDGQPELF